MNKFVPDDVPPEKVALLGAATDWLDGLNKELDSWVCPHLPDDNQSRMLTDVDRTPRSTWANSAASVLKKRCTS